MKEKGVSANVTESKTTFAGKTIAIATALVAVLSFGALGAYGAGETADIGTDVPLAAEDAARVIFSGEGATAYVNGQPVVAATDETNGTVNALANQDFIFQVDPMDGYDDVVVEAFAPDGTPLAFASENPYIIAAADVQDGIRVTFSGTIYQTGDLINEQDEGILTITIITPSDTKVYDGQPLIAEEGVMITLPGTTSEVRNQELAQLLGSFRITGSQTDVGQSENTYYMDWTGIDQSKYDVQATLGTLTVEPNGAPISIVAPTLTKTYDGTPLVAEQADISAPPGINVQASVAGEITDAGTVKSVVTEYAILDANGYDVSDAYGEPQIIDGLLTVNPAPITVTTPNASKTHDGTALTATADEWITGFVNGETATATITGSQTEVGSSLNTYSIEWNGTANENNYSIAEYLGVLEVTPDSGAPNNGATNGGNGGTTGSGATGGGTAATPVYGATAVSSTPGVSYVSDTPDATAAASDAKKDEANAVDTVAEAMQNTARGIVGEDPVPLTAPVTAELDEDSTPLGAFDEPADNWVRWYVVVGIIATGLYGLGVLMRRRNFTKGLEDQENSMLGLASEQEVSASVPADVVVRGA